MFTLRLKLVCLPVAATFAVPLFSMSSPADALTITAAENAGDVIFSGSGSLNLSALTLTFTNGYSIPWAAPAESSFLLGPINGAAYDAYEAISFPADFGPGALPGGMVASDGSGDLFGPLPYFGDELWVPTGYQSGDPLSAQIIFSRESFASLGMIPGVYIWSWGSGADADNLTLKVEPTIPPVPGPVPLLGAGAALSWTRRLRRRLKQAQGSTFDQIHKR